MRISEISSVRKVREALRGSTVNMRRRLLAFLLLLVLTMLVGVMFLLSLFDVFPSADSETKRLFSKELYHLSETTEAQFGDASVQASRMSEQLSTNLTALMKQENLTAADLKAHPELLETLLGELLPSLIQNLDATDCSGVFLTLDATTNPEAPGAQWSKAGLYLRTVEPNIGGAGTKARFLLRGYSSFASEFRLNLQSEWELEFDVRDQMFWQKPLAALLGANPSLPLSRFVHWSSMSAVPGLNEDVMICSVPLMDSDGRVLGVCGFEISEMNFMLRHEPEDSDFSGMVFLFSSAKGSDIRLEGSLFSGNNAVYEALPEQGLMSGAGEVGGFVLYQVPESGSLIGLSKAIRLYPDDSPFAAQTFIASVLIPKADFDAAQNALNLRFSVIMFALMVLGIVASLFIARRYMKPVTDSLKRMDAGGEGGMAKTNIQEIDALLERLMAIHGGGDPIFANLFESFIAKTKTLTETERKVFWHLVDKESQQEIIATMYIAQSTLQKHCTSIFRKLGVKSKDELTAYTDLIRQCGLMPELLLESEKPSREDGGA